MNIKKIKETAIKRLEGNYLKAVLALVIFSLIIMSFAGISHLIYNENMSSFFNIIIMGLLYMGLIQIFIKIARRKKTSVKELFSRTDLFWKSSAITIILMSFTLLCILLEYIAFKSLNIFTVYQTDMSKPIIGVMILVGILLCTLIALFYIIIMISFSQVYYVLYDNENMPVIDIFNRSADLIEKHKLDYVLFKLSFIGWIIAGILTFGILFVWITPYMMVSEVNFYDELVKIDKKKSKKAKK